MMNKILELTKQLNNATELVKGIIELVKENKKLKDELSEFQNYRDIISKGDFYPQFEELKEFLETTKSYDNFRIDVQNCTTHNDFKENKSILWQVNQENYSHFIDLLKYGTGIGNSLKCLEKIKQTSIETKLTEEEIIDLLGTFRLINNYLFK